LPSGLLACEKALELQLAVYGRPQTRDKLQIAFGSKFNFYAQIVLTQLTSKYDVKTRLDLKFAVGSLS
jgi:hypothetical protein